jgi:hypothetical protein
MILFWVLFAIDALIVSFGLYNFVEGLGEGTIASHVPVWLGFLGGPILILTLGCVFKRQRRLGYANITLLLLAVPGAPIAWLIHAFESGGHH